MVLQLFVVIRMDRHVVDVDFLGRSEREAVANNLFHQPEAFVVLTPPGEIMEAGGIAVHHAVAVSDLAQMVAEGVKSALVVFVAEIQGEHGLHECGAVQSMDIHDQVLVVAFLKGVAYVGNA